MVKSASGVNVVRRTILRGVLAVFSMVFVPTPAWSAAQPTVLVLGDSISAEYGLPRDAGWVNLLVERLRQNGYRYRVVNASISGETTSGGLSRLPALLKQHAPQVVILELGGNDGLRGLDPSVTEKNLEQMIVASKNAGARVLLVGMRLPPNYGRDFTTRFESLFGRLAARHRTGLVNYFFEGFTQTSEYFQPDRIHPTVRAQPVLLDNIWPELRRLLTR